MSVQASSAQTPKPPQFGASGPQVKTALEMLRCAAERQKGSHLTMKTPGGRPLPPVPMHGGKDLSPGVMGSIAKAIGTTRQQLESWASTPKQLKQAIKGNTLPEPVRKLLDTHA